MTSGRSPNADAPDGAPAVGGVAHPPTAGRRRAAVFATREEREAALRLAGVTFLILFLELALIRYLSGYVRVFGFYLNLVVIATFLGMGVGLLRAERADRLRWLAPVALLVLFGAVRVLSRIIFAAPRDRDEYLWGVTGENPLGLRWSEVGVAPVVVALFAVVALLMVPLGAAMGREFRRLPALTAYSVDIAGSLAGILAFAALSAQRTPPVVWFAVALVLWIALAAGERGYAAALAAAGAASLWLAAATAGPPPEYWSPYYRINVLRVPQAITVHVNGVMHQWILDLGPEGIRRNEAAAMAARHFREPFAFAPRLDTVLVVGAGTGNDVANLLAAGAGHVDAVEIDPVILDLGVAGHPQRPYEDPRVRRVVDDARAFLRRTDRRYDLIVFGTLDSQTLLSGMSSLRLDNYIYTVEAFRSARERLRPDGVLVAYHMSGYPFVAAKIYQSIGAAFGRAPWVVHHRPHLLFNYTFVAGAAVPGGAAPAGTGVAAPVELPRDDWPYLYLRDRVVPRHYLVVLGGVLAVALAVVLAGARGALRGGPDWPMFLLGAGFLLVEAKSVSEMSLLFGATWRVNLLVFSSVLVVVLAANVAVARGRAPSLRGSFAGLFAALAAAYAVPVRALLWLGPAGQWALGGTLVALPIFFAAVAFARILRERADPTRALASNLLGAIVGGVLEYASMVVGTKALYLLAAAVYLGAALTAGVLVPRRRSA